MLQVSPKDASGRSTEKQFCPYCGTKLDPGARFCKNCGSSISNQRGREEAEQFTGDGTERKAVYEGRLHKCPNCGEIIQSFVAVCPSCGYELRDSAATTSVQELYKMLKAAIPVEQKAIIIRNYPIPNAKEDILEFMILAASNISGEADRNLFEAWSAKFEQAYQKARLTLQNDSVFPEIEAIYEKTAQTIAKEKRSHTTATAGNVVTGLLRSMPNPVFAVVMVLVLIFAFVRLFRGEFAGIDIICDAIVLGAAYKITWRKGKKEQERSGRSRSGEPSQPQEERAMAKVPFSVIGGTSDHYTVVETLFTQAGFLNVRTVPLYDLTFGVMKKPGSVDQITIKGKELSTYFRRKFDADVPVVITYHSYRQ